MPDPPRYDGEGPDDPASLYHLATIWEERLELEEMRAPKDEQEDNDDPPRDDGLRYQPYEVHYRSNKCELSTTEYKLFEQLASSRYLVNRNSVQLKVWPNSDVEPKTITSTLSHIRKKLRTAGMDDVAACLMEKDHCYGFRRDQLG